MDPKFKAQITDTIRQATKLAENAVSMSNPSHNAPDGLRQARAIESMAQSLASLAIMATVVGSVFLEASEQEDKSGR